jgi:hypothetical protein
MSSLGVALSMAVVVGLSSAAYGQSSSERAASAEALFREAKALMEDGNYASACPKLAASQRLDPAVGTMLNLAICHQEVGMTASAWAEYLRAASMARGKGQIDREKFALEKAAALETRLTRLAFAVAEEALIAGLEVRRDGIPVESATWATSTPVDPGTHEITATAPGKIEWRTTVDASGEGKTFTVDIPPLEDAPPEVKPVAQPQPAQAVPSGPASAMVPTSDRGVSGDTQRTAGILVGGVGLAGLAAGSIFGLSARSKWNDTSCPGNVCPTAEQQDRAEDAQRFATVSTWTFAGGGLFLATGVVLYLTAPATPPRGEVASGVPMGLRVVPAAGEDSNGLLVHGWF